MKYVSWRSVKIGDTAFFWLKLDTGAACDGALVCFWKDISKNATLQMHIIGADK